MEKVSKIKVENDIKKSILKAVDEIGGFEKFIKPGDTVLLKPNFNTADPFPASTDINFLKGVVEIVYEKGAKEVIIGDSSTFMVKTKKVMEEIGVFNLEKMNPAPKIVVFEEHKWARKEIPNGKYLKNVSVPEILEKVDKLILLPCLKTHFIAQFTGALKLSVGFIKPIQRLKFHISNIQEKIAELNTLISPDLIIMDARKCFVTKGPSSGEIREPNLILASKSRVAIDIEGMKIIQSFKNNSLGGIDPLKLSQIKRAIKLGIGI